MAMTERDPLWKIAPDPPPPVPQNPPPTPISSAKPNRGFAEGLLEAARLELARQPDQLMPMIDERRMRQLGRQIEATKQRGRDGEDVGDRLLKLRREHHKTTGTGGGA